MEHLTIIGFDYGTKYIGLAVGQTLTKTAKPLLSITSIDGAPDWKRIKTVIHEWRPQALVVGIPLNMDGTTQPITFLAQDFANQLRNEFNLPVYEIDERLTTVEARAQIYSQRGYKGLTKSAIDSFAAKIIVEDWLNQNSKLT